MVEYAMSFIRSEEGVRRDVDGWDEGLVNFGYEALEDEPIRLAAQNFDDARTEAWTRWQDRPVQFRGGKAEGYWIYTPDGWIRHTWVADGPEPA
jgi:hypothetical protein